MRILTAVVENIESIVGLCVASWRSSGDGQMGRIEDAMKYFNLLEELSRDRPIAESVWAMAYLAVSDDERAYRRLENAVSSPLGADQIALSELKANPHGAAVLDEPRWRELDNRIGALD